MWTRALLCVCSGPARSVPLCLLLEVLELVRSYGADAVQEASRRLETCSALATALADSKGEGAAVECTHTV